MIPGKKKSGFLYVLFIPHRTRMVIYCDLLYVLYVQVVSEKETTLYMENVKSVPENPSVCWTFLCNAPEFLINWYHSLHFRCLFHFTVAELELKKCSGVNLKYEVGERRSYKKSTNIFKTIYCVNISFAQWSEEKRVEHQSGLHNKRCKVNDTVSLSCICKVQFATPSQMGGEARYRWKRLC